MDIHTLKYGLTQSKDIITQTSDHEHTRNEYILSMTQFNYIIDKYRGVQFKTIFVTQP